MPLIKLANIISSSVIPRKNICLQTASKLGTGNATGIDCLSSKVLKAGTYQIARPPRGGGRVSLVDDIRECSKAQRCFFVIFGISMAPNLQNCVYFGKFGQKLSQKTLN